ncbi:hypothetical protein BT67DRAFT_442320 [Trichocladium antarcticum]|uniref:Uncharacterized protein n=1 Tax=Trichocladium antarcticum TaxID=1450529 RepID=A0AAN6ZCV5_9PEZI|nr:hypothetical protein BT67DRAFT_442320 [Trichocladium antarcticum]
MPRGHVASCDHGCFCLMWPSTAAALPREVTAMVVSARLDKHMQSNNPNSEASSQKLEQSQHRGFQIGITVFEKSRSSLRGQQPNGYEESGAGTVPKYMSCYVPLMAMAMRSESTVLSRA